MPEDEIESLIFCLNENHVSFEGKPINRDNIVDILLIEANGNNGSYLSQELAFGLYDYFGGSDYNHYLIDGYLLGNIICEYEGEQMSYVISYEFVKIYPEHHTHTNKSELDKIQEGDKAKWDEKLDTTIVDSSLEIVDNEGRIVFRVNNDGVNTGHLMVKGDEVALKKDLETHLNADSIHHTHANKSELDKIQEGDKAKWDNASNISHNHTNKTLLDTYTQTEANLKDAVNKKHSHTNKTLLDSYTQTEANLADAVSKKHSHTNKTLLDSYTQTEANLADAVSKKHSHANKSELDKIQDGDKAKWDSKSDSGHGHIISDVSGLQGALDSKLDEVSDTDSFIITDGVGNIPFRIDEEGVTANTMYAENGFYETSDIRKKNVIEELPLDKAYELINNCQSIIYTLKDNTDKQQIGLIAQEVQQYFPEAVSEDESGYLSLDYAKLTSVIFRVLKDVIDRLNKLENK